jgi:hypothetical protein
MSALRQKQTLCGAAKLRLFDHLVGAGKQCLPLQEKTDDGCVPLTQNSRASYAAAPKNPATSETVRHGPVSW